MLGPAAPGSHFSARLDLNLTLSSTLACMRAIRLHEFGPATNLTLVELPDLEPAPGEVRIAVEAAGVHLLDISLRQGEPGPVPLPELPTIPGREVAGVVDALGSGVDESWRGQRVVAHLGRVPGGYATQAKTSVANLFRVPEHVDAVSAVAAVGTGRTALGILETEPIRPDDVVLLPSPPAVSAGYSCRRRRRSAQPWSPPQAARPSWTGSPS